MARHANSPSGPGKPTAVETSDIMQEEGFIELSSEDDAIGGVEGAGVEKRDTTNNQGSATSVKGE
jgi:hypothetical protein